MKWMPWLVLAGWMLVGMATVTHGTDHSRSERDAWIDLQLSAEQRAWLDFLRRCHRENRYSPYLFELDKGQRSELRALGIPSPSRLVVFDQRNTGAPVEIRLSHALRTSDALLRVPLPTLVDETTLRRYERDVMGWEENPLRWRWSRLGPDERVPGAQPRCD